jgi:putative FmdB family regulatory protein
MPIYEYVCQDCQTRYERLVLSNNGDLACPKCGSKQATLQFSTFASPRTEGAADAAPSCGCSPTGCGCH